ncbi:bromodomain-containing protein [Coccidioides immitis H538.4]|uniref:Bromodomain-containing protein n=1 Tax=Coccidioides immitis H538.4 TaxID=396776 RepID=A0A0J8RUL5_COCIT|nr:bromodomain-containing protein [Coccidioides immitis H538.4]
MVTPPPEATALEDKVKLLPVADPAVAATTTGPLDKMDEAAGRVDRSLSPLANGTSLPNGTKEALNGLTSPSTEKEPKPAAETTSSNSFLTRANEVETSSSLPKADTLDEEKKTKPTESEANLRNELSAPDTATEVVTSLVPQGEQVMPQVEKAEDKPLSQPISPPATAPVVEPNETQSSAPAPTLSTSQDQTMAEAPPLCRGNGKRMRQMNQQLNAPRPDAITPPQAEFKVPDLPPPASTAITPLQNKFFIRTLAALKRTHDARFFRVPVDPVKLNIPNYPTIIKEPMDLHTMEDKIKSGAYKTVDQITADFKLMIDNCITFNGPEHVVTVEGMRLRDNWERHLTKLPSPSEVEPTAAEKKAKKASTAPTKTQPARRESQAKAAAPKVANATSPTTFALGPENRDLPYSTKPKKKKFHWELKFCEEVIDELHKPKHYNFAAPFYQPVDPVALNIPTYHNIIKKPMDLSTIRTKLQTGQYENSKEMENDVRLMFKNCYKFNIPGDPTYNAGKKLEEIFDYKWGQKARWLETHDPASAHQSDSSDNESSEGEESNDDEQHEKLQILQKQIAEMSKQVEAIRQKKKKTPPGPSKKASKAKPGKKDNKKGAPSRKDKKGGSKSTKSSEKQRWITYREKQIISHGISTLPENKVQDALHIIQSNVPSLKGTDQAEVELDIDELPNNVLVLLLNFVKKHAPQSFEFDEPAPEPLPTAVPAKPKKNKPMNAHEQEAQIGRLAGTLSKFQGGAQSSDPTVIANADLVHSEAARESSDDDDSEESEEE